MRSGSGRHRREVATLVFPIAYITLVLLPVGKLVPGVPPLSENGADCNAACKRKQPCPVSVDHRRVPCGLRADLKLDCDAKCCRCVDAHTASGPGCRRRIQCALTDRKARGRRLLSALTVRHAHAQPAANASQQEAVLNKNRIRGRIQEAQGKVKKATGKLQADHGDRTAQISSKP